MVFYHVSTAVKQAERKGAQFQGKKPNKSRGSEQVYHRVIKDYLNGNEKEVENDFERRLSMKRVVFHRILARLKLNVCSNRDLIARERRVNIALITTIEALLMLGYSTSVD